jgi:hypothetical protein
VSACGQAFEPTLVVNVHIPFERAPGRSTTPRTVSPISTTSSQSDFMRCSARSTTTSGWRFRIEASWASSVWRNTAEVGHSETLIAHDFVMKA